MLGIKSVEDAVAGFWGRGWRVEVTYPPPREITGGLAGNEFVTTDAPTKRGSTH